MRSFKGVLTDTILQGRKVYLSAWAKIVRLDPMQRQSGFPRLLRPDGFSCIDSNQGPGHRAHLAALQQTAPRLPLARPGVEVIHDRGE